MNGTKSILRTVVGGLLLAAIVVLGGCGGGHDRHVSYGSRDSYPSYSRGGGGHDRDGGFRGGDGGDGGDADRDNSWRHR